MAFRHIIGSTFIFSAGIISSNAVRHSLANFVSDEPLPDVSVSYQKSGTYVNGERVDSLGRVGGARCDWGELAADARTGYVLSELHANRSLANTYVGKLSTDDQMNLAYRSLVQLAKKAGGSIGDEIDRMKDAVGFRWELQYTPTEDSLGAPGRR